MMAIQYIYVIKSDSSYCFIHYRTLEYIKSLNTNNNNNNNNRLDFTSQYQLRCCFIEGRMVKQAILGIKGATCDPFSIILINR